MKRSRLKTNMEKLIRQFMVSWAVLTISVLIGATCTVLLYTHGVSDELSIGIAFTWTVIPAVVVFTALYTHNNSLRELLHSIFMHCMFPQYSNLQSSTRVAPNSIFSQYAHVIRKPELAMRQEDASENKQRIQVNNLRCLLGKPVTNLPHSMMDKHKDFEVPARIAINELNREESEEYGKEAIKYKKALFIEDVNIRWQLQGKWLSNLSSVGNIQSNCEIPRSHEHMATN